MEIDLGSAVLRSFRPEDEGTIRRAIVKADRIMDLDVYSRLRKSTT